MMNQGSIGWCAGRRCSSRNGHGQADADERSLVGGIGQARDDADHLPVAVKQRAAGVAGVHGCVELDQPRQVLAAVSDRHRAVEAGDDSGGHRPRQAEGIADGVGFVADSHRPQAAKHGRNDQGRWLVRLQDGDVDIGLSVDHLSRGF